MPLVDLNKRILNSLFGESVRHNTKNCNVLKKHSQDLRESGDLSLSLDHKIRENKIMAECLEIHEFKINCVSLIEKSTGWPIPIEKINFKNNRCILHLSKFKAMQFIFKEVLDNPSFGKIKLKHNFHIIFPDKCDSDLTNWRTKLVASTISNVIKFCKNEEFYSDNEYEICFSNNGQKSNMKNVIKCGLVINASTKKKSCMSYNDYFCCRRRDMQLVAMHKYGMRTHDNIYFGKFLDKLGAAAVIVDLLEAKYSSPVQVANDYSRSSKGASFILYNYARVSTLLELFTDRVRKQFYSELPELSEIDITTLKEEEEWQLVYNFILNFPSVIARVLNNLENGQCAPHLIIQFLTGLVSLFSIYYRRVKILVDNREHLMMNLFARIYLLKCIQKIFKMCLEYIDIEPIYKM